MYDEHALSLEGMKAVVLGIANRDSIAYGCAKAFRHLGADLAISYRNENAKPHVKPIAEELEAEIFLPCDVQQQEQMDHLFAEINNRGGRLDIGLHVISPGPLKTRAASGLKAFDDLLDQTTQRAPIHQLASIEDVGMATATLATPSARIMTGETIYIDGGANIMA